MRWTFCLWRSQGSFFTLKKVKPIIIEPEFIIDKDKRRKIDDINTEISVKNISVKYAIKGKKIEQNTPINSQRIIFFCFIDHAVL